MKTKPEKKFKLRPELIPTSMWGMSVYRQIGKRKAWDEIRNETRRMANGKCEICYSSTSPRYYCHEKWLYQDKRGQAQLIGFGWICELCNHATHFGRANQLNFEYPGLTEAVIKHMMKVNKASHEEVEILVAGQIKQWERRSGIQWELEISPQLIKKYPALSTLDFSSTLQL